MIFEFGKFCVDVDVERTRAFYDKHGKTVIEDCGCVNCRNYYESILTVSDKVTTFFRSLGIDPRKSPEVTWWYTDENGVAYYTICFHLVGTLVNSVALCRLAGDHGMETIIENFHEIDTGFKIGFTSQVVILEQNFPEPCIQLEIEAHIPWVLD